MPDALILQRLGNYIRIYQCPWCWQTWTDWEDLARHYREVSHAG